MKACISTRWASRTHGQLGEMELGGGIDKLLLSTESFPYVWVNSRNPALMKEQGGVRPGG